MNNIAQASHIMVFKLILLAICALTVHVSFGSPHHCQQDLMHMTADAAASATHGVFAFPIMPGTLFSANGCGSDTGRKARCLVCCNRLWHLRFLASRVCVKPKHCMWLSYSAVDVGTPHMLPCRHSTLT